jgi:hypothetical protein
MPLIVAYITIVISICNMNNSQLLLIYMYNTTFILINKALQ